MLILIVAALGQNLKGTFVRTNQGVTASLAADTSATPTQIQGGPGAVTPVTP